MAAAGAHLGPPNVLSIVWEDASIAAWDAFGGLIEMPNLKRLTARGLRYSQWSRQGAATEPGRGGRSPIALRLSRVTAVRTGKTSRAWPAGSPR
jgi:arylsulfatase A-like enzyme